MTTPRTTLTDAAIEEALARRAPRDPDPSLLAGIAAQASTSGQSAGWWRSFGLARVGRVAVVAWIIIGLIAALTIGVLTGGFDRSRNDLSAIPTPHPIASPSLAAIAPSPAPTTPVRGVTESPAPTNDGIPRVSSLPSTSEGISQLLPDTLCGRPATKTSYAAPEDPDRGPRSGPPLVYVAALEDMAVAAGASEDQVRYVTATTSNLAGPCPVAGLFRVIGGVPTAMRDAFDDSFARSAIHCSSLGLDGVDGEVIDCTGDAWDTYYVFAQDAVSFVVATRDDLAARVLRAMPQDGPVGSGPPKVAPPITERTAFHSPLVVTYDRLWSLTTDTPTLVELTYSEAPQAYITIARPAGYKSTAALEADLRTEEATIHWCPAMTRPWRDSIAGLRFDTFECDGEASTGWRAFFPLTQAAAAAGFQATGPGTPDWFALSKGEYARFFMADVGGAPVVIVIRANLDQRAFYAFRLRAEDMLARVTFKP